MFDALVLAGGGKPEPLIEQEGVSNKAFIVVQGRPLLAYILRALQEAPSVDRIIVIGPESNLESLRQDGYIFEIMPEKGGILDNVAAGFEIVEQNRLCLVVTADIPLLNAEVIEEFIKLCAPYDYDFYYPILSRETCLLHFPETERTYVRLKEGHVTGGNIGFVSPSWFLENRGRLELFISYRKKPLKLLRILPPLFIIKYLLKTLSLSDLEHSISRLLHFKARAVPCECVEIGVDVDKISDLELIRKVLKS
jgi:molybdopterin-guanine dinucleotide biosynthesis protein A